MAAHPVKLASDRRTVLRLAMAAAVAPAFAGRARATTASGGGRLAPPGGPMTFTRRLVRSLPDGNSLIVGRSFAVRFAPMGAG